MLRFHSLEWLVCAARGLLRGQKSRKIRFARDLRWIRLQGGPNPRFGVCSGWTDVGCDTQTRFANDDIFFLEVCLFSKICTNREQLFRTGRGADFVCELDREGMAQLRDLLVYGSVRGP